MTLHQLLHEVSFDKVFSNIIRYMPEVEDKKDCFKLAFNTLCAITPAKESKTVIGIDEKSYLGEGVQDLWIDVPSFDSDIWRNLLGGQIKRRK